jgi:hypothetical protein
MAGYDIAQINLRRALGLPGADNLEVSQSLRIVDHWANIVGRYTQQAARQFDRHPENYENSRPFFCLLTMVTAIQKGLGIGYNAELIDRDDFFADSRNLFIHGIILGRGGTCSSLPPLYVAIGRRLGYPLKLVSTKCHLFARWDEPCGERRNLECACPGLNCYSDDHYREWPIPITPDEEERFGWLKSKTPSEEQALFLGIRGHCWLANGEFQRAAECYTLAAEFEPANQLPRDSARWALKLLRTNRAGKADVDRPLHLYRTPDPDQMTYCLERSFFIL